MDDLTAWLLDKIANYNIAQNTLLIDIGAYHGDFTRTLLQSAQFQAAILFEPNQKNLAVLKSAFKNESRVSVVDAAISDCSEETYFYSSNELATGSILPYAETSAATSEITGNIVTQMTLDNYLANKNLNNKVGVIKIDTQGCDLRVLKGALTTLKKDKPLLVVELIFVNLYQGQATPPCHHRMVVRAWIYCC